MFPQDHEFMREVRKLVDGGKTRAEAIKTVAADRPDLHRAFLEAANPGRDVAHLTSDAA